MRGNWRRGWTKIPELLTAYSPDGWTLLHLAPWAGQPETTRLLLERGADLTAVSTNALRNQPLNAAVAGPNAETRTACVRLLLEAGADANNRQERGHTPLHTSAHLGDNSNSRGAAGAWRGHRVAVGRRECGGRLRAGGRA